MLCNINIIILFNYYILKFNKERQTDFLSMYTTPTNFKTLETVLSKHTELSACTEMPATSAISCEREIQEGDSRYV